MEWYYIVIIVIVILVILVGLGVALYLIIHEMNNDEDDSPEEIKGVITVINQFDFPIWIEARYGNDGMPIEPIGPLYLDMNTLQKYASATEQATWMKAITTVELPPKKSVSYDIDKGGIAGARFWAKFSCNGCGQDGTSAKEPALCLPPFPVGCATNISTCTYDGAGTDCLLGDSSQYYVPGQGSVGGCKQGGCSVPIDSLFEATFACTLSDQSQCNPNPADPSQKLGSTTFFDTSQVDGYTFPYLVLITANTGTTGLSTCFNTNSGVNMPVSTFNNKDVCYIDGSGLIADAPGLIMPYNQNLDIGCPNNANLANGSITTVTDNSFSGQPAVYDLTNVDLGFYVNPINMQTYPQLDSNNQPVNPPNNAIKIGCMSSCKRLNYGQPYGMNQSEGCDPTLYYCCPTTLGSQGCTLPIGITGNNCCSNLPSPLCPNCQNCTNCIPSVENNGICQGCQNCSGINNSNITGCITSFACNSGPVVNSAYVKSIHNMAPGVYAFAYDDQQGLYSCGADVHYWVIFGPTGSSASDYWNTTVWPNIKQSSTTTATLVCDNNIGICYNK